MNFENLLITPEAAQKLLDNENAHNRTLSERVVTFYAQQMQNGQWRENTAEPIKIAKDGRLMDGQHRLAALVKFGQPLMFTVATGLDFENVFTVLDTGKKRNASDALTISGIKYANQKAAGITNYLVLKSGKTIRDGAGISRVAIGLTNQIILDEYNSRPDFWDMITERSVANYHQSNGLLVASFIIAWSAKLHEVDAEKGREFMAKLCSGENLTASDAIYHLRQFLLRAKMSATRKLDNKYRNAMLIKAWNKFYKGVSVKALAFSPKTESYPKIAGDNTTYGIEDLTTVGVN